VQADSRAKFVRDFVAGWDTVMNLYRFDVVARGGARSAERAFA
jgi:hypothetical protein